MEAIVEVTRRGPVTVLTVSRGKVNAIDVEMAEELSLTLSRLEDDDDVAAVVLTGSGKVFSAGVDLRRVLDEEPSYGRRLVAGLRDVFESLFRFPKPVVAAVNGAAVAGGCIMACACDRRVIAAGAAMGVTELVVGVPFPASALEIMRHACGSRTEDVVFAGALLDADGALAVGMVHEVVDRADVLERAVALAGELGALPGPAFRLAKEQLRRPAVERMRTDGAVLDADVIRGWEAPATRERLLAQLDKLSSGR